MMKAPRVGPTIGTGKNRTIIDLHADQTRSTPFGVGGAATPRQVSLVLNPMNSGTDRLLITTDGQLTNIEEFQDTQRNKLLMARKDIANSVMDLEVLVQLPIKLMKVKIILLKIFYYLRILLNQKFLIEL
mgnify:CR=1 FL=1